MATTYIHEVAVRPSGNATAVKSTYDYQNKSPRFAVLNILTDANSYDLAFQVERKWHTKRLYVIHSDRTLFRTPRSMSGNTSQHRYATSIEHDHMFSKFADFRGELRNPKTKQ